VTFDQVTPKIIGFLCYPRWMYGPSLRKVGQGILKLLKGMVLAHLTWVTLNFDPVTLVSIWFLCCPGQCVEQV